MPRRWVCRVKTPGCSQDEPCRSCRGRQAHEQGHAGQHAVWKILNRIFGNTVRYRSKTTNEENWRFPLKIEVKTERSIVKPVFTAHGRMEHQAITGRSLGDPRVVATVAWDEERGDGVIQIRMSDLEKAVSDMVEAVLDKQAREEAAAPVRRIGGLR